MKPTYQTNPNLSTIHGGHNLNGSKELLSLVGAFFQLIHAFEVLTFMTAYSILHLLRNVAIDLWLSVVVYLLLCGFERGYRVLIIRRNNTDFMVLYLWTYRLVSTPRVGTVLRIG